MPTKWTPAKTAVSTSGIVIAFLGVIWENLFGPSWLGWAAIIAGSLLIVVIEKPRAAPLSWPLLLLSVMAGISLFVTADPHLTNPQVTRLLAGVAAYFALVHWARTRRQVFLVAFVLITFGALIAILAPFIVRWNLAKGVPIPGIIYETFPLLVADAVHPNVMVSIMIMLIPLPFACYLLSGRKAPWPLPARWQPWFLLLALSLMSLVLLLTKSRGGYVAAAIAILMVLWFSRHRLVALALTLITIAAGAWLFIAAQQEASIQVASTLAGELADSSTLAFRQQVWHTASWMIAEFPFTGVGLGAFNNVAVRLYPLPEVADPGAHNFYLQVGVDLGLPGLIAMLAILLLTVAMSISSIILAGRQQDKPLHALSVGLLAGLAALLFHGLVDITVWGTRIGFLPWIIFGLVTAVHLQLKPAQT